VGWKSVVQAEAGVPALGKIVGHGDDLYLGMAVYFRCAETKKAGEISLASLWSCVFAYWTC
jgi:hypothetical protein